MLRRERSSGTFLMASQSCSRWTCSWQNAFSWLSEIPWCLAFAASLAHPSQESVFSSLTGVFGRVGKSVVPSGTSCGLVLLNTRAEMENDESSSDSLEALYPVDRLSLGEALPLVDVWASMGEKGGVVSFFGSFALGI